VCTFEQGGEFPFAYCCDTGWDSFCAQAAITQIGCARLGFPVCIATSCNPADEGYLRICSDPYGSWSDDETYGDGAGDPNWGDEFNPVGDAIDALTFTAGFYIFAGGDNGPPQVDGDQRELLTTNTQWEGIFSNDRTLQDLWEGVTSDEFDTNGDNCSDTLTSAFRVWSFFPPNIVDLHFDLTQEVVAVSPGISKIVQTLEIRNDHPDAYTFEIVRHIDGDIPYPRAGDFFFDDSVGTGTNGLPALDRFVFMHNTGDPDEGVTLSVSSDVTDEIYYGCILTHDPDTAAGPCVPHGYGTDTQIWDAWGVPCAWENYIPTAMPTGGLYDIDGQSGTLNNDGSIGLEARVINLAGSGGTTTVIFTTTYGDDIPH
jgi:hypothetical protein